MPSVKRPDRQSGQAIVESALTLPLMVFMLLGTMQLFMMMHGRILTQLAAFQATRTGSLNHGNCARMLHSAILQVLPAIEPFAKNNGVALDQNVANTFAKYQNNNYNGKNTNIGPAKSQNLTGSVFWIVRNITGRVAPMFSGPNQADDDFDQNGAAQILETKVIFWFPMRVPFANWVIGRAILAHYNLQAYSNQNPLLISQKSNWAGPGTSIAPEIQAELAARMLSNEYVFPIVASYTMRMMTPLKQVNYALPGGKNCPGTPPAL